MQKINKILPCFWFDGNTDQAFKLYCEAFDNSRWEKMNPFLSKVEITGCEIWGLDGGPMFKPNPTLSLYTTYDNSEDLLKTYNVLSREAKILMPLDKYDWSAEYAWVEDRYGISWQLILVEGEPIPQRIMPTLMFVDNVYGRAEEAISFYGSLFTDSEIHLLDKYKEGPQDGKIIHAQFSIGGLRMAAMDSGFQHNFGFTEGTSMVILCETQEEIDHYWNSFITDGEEGRCGWCKDQFGFSWQVIPRILGKLMSDPDTGPEVGACLQNMHKLDLGKLLEASGRNNNV